MKAMIFIFTIFCKTVFLYATPLAGAIQGVVAPGIKDAGLRMRYTNPPDQPNDLQQKVLLFNMCYPDFSIASLIPASAAVQSALSPHQQTLAKLHLQVLEKIFHDYAPIRSTFSAMLFMLQNPQVMRKITEAAPGMDNGLPLLTSGDASVQSHALNLLQRFESFVRSFNVGALLQSMADVPPEASAKATSHLEELHKIVGSDSAYSTFIQGMILGLAVQQSNSSPQMAANGNSKQLPNSMRELAGIMLLTKGNVIKNMGTAADVVFENVKDANDAVQGWTSLLKSLPIFGKAVEPVHKTVNTLLDRVHMVVGDTAHSVGDSLQSEGNKMLRRQETVSFANDDGFGLDGIMKT